MADQALKTRIKEVMVEALMLDLEVDEIGDNDPLFGPDGVGLDSVDALQLSVEIGKHFDLKIEDAEKAKEILTSVETIATAVEAKRAGG